MKEDIERPQTAMIHHGYTVTSSMSSGREANFREGQSQATSRGRGAYKRPCAFSPLYRKKNTRATASQTGQRATFRGAKLRQTGGRGGSNWLSQHGGGRDIAEATLRAAEF